MPRNSKSAEINTRRVGDVGVVDVEGRITLGESARQLRTTVQSLAGEVPGSILINMAGTSYIDSAGLGTLASSHLELKSRGGLGLIAVQPQVLGLLDMTKLSSVMTIHATEQEALEACSAGMESRSLPLKSGETVPLT